MLLIFLFTKRDPALVGMRLCDGCYSRILKFDRIYKIFINTGVALLFVAYLIFSANPRYFYLTVFGVIIELIPQFMYGYYKCPKIFSRGAKGFVITLFDDRYEKIFKEYIKSKDTGGGSTEAARAFIEPSGQH
jgi:hypothetical protein